MKTDGNRGRVDRVGALTSFSNWQRRRRLSVCLVLILFLVFTAYAAIRTPWNRAAAQQRGIAAIREAGGIVICEHEVDSQGMHITNVPPPGPAVCRRLLGDDFFVKAIRVYIDGTTPAETVGPYLAKLPYLSMLHIYGPAADDGLLDQLEDSSSSIESLSLIDGPISDHGLRRLSSWRQLRYLEICGTRVTDAGIASLSDLPAIRTIVLSKANIGNSSLQVLGKMETLREIRIADTRVDDDGLRFLREHQTLKRIELRGTNVSDSGVVVLTSLPQLKSVDLRGTKVTRAGIERLVQVMPHVVVYWSSDL